MHRVFPSSCNIAASSRKIQFRRASIGDSRAVVTPFMQDGTYPPRNFATLGPSGLRPPFTGVCNFSLHIKNLALQHRAGVRSYTSYLNLAKSYVFIKQSLLSLFCCLKPPLSRSYRVILPSSFNTNYSFAIIYSTCTLVLELVRFKKI